VLAEARERVKAKDLARVSV